MFAVNVFIVDFEQVLAHMEWINILSKFGLADVQKAQIKQ